MADTEVAVKASIPAIWLLSGDIMSQLGGGFRQQRWCEYLLKRGQAIRLFYAPGPLGVRWVDVASVEQLRTLRQEWIAAAPSRAGVRDSRAARIGRYLKHMLLLDLFYPSNFRLIWTLSRMMALAPERVALLCSSPPFAMGVVGRIMKARFGRRVLMVLDMRDLWSLHTAFPDPKVHKRLIEGWVTRGADIYTTVAPALASRLQKAFGPVPDVVFNVATHIPGSGPDLTDFDWRQLSPLLRPDSRKVVYTGSVPAGFYDLAGLLDAIEAFSRRSGGDNLQFVFVGAGGEVGRAMQGRKIPEDLIVFVPQLSHDAVSNVQRAADVLMFLGYRAEDNQGQVSIKLFEYFRREKPILPVHIRAASDVDWLVRHYAGFCPNLLTRDELVEALVCIAATGGADLPRAKEVAAREASLLHAYDDVSARIVDDICGGAT